MSEFREIIILGAVSGNTIEFGFGDFNEIVVDIPEEFLRAAWGYGTHYGRFYGHT